jgi:hypothetical protein
MPSYQAIENTSHKSMSILDVLDPRISQNPSPKNVTILQTDSARLISTKCKRQSSRTIILIFKLIYIPITGLSAQLICLPRVLKGTLTQNYSGKFPRNQVWRDFTLLTCNKILATEKGIAIP